MFYKKNLPTWERAVRLLGAALMAFCAWRMQAGPGLYVFGAMAIVTGLTAVFGFCPMCAMAGRKLDAVNKTRQ